jgi:predicted ATPase
VAAVLEACPSVVVIATSRAALRLRGENEYAVQPLALPKEVHDLTAVEASPAGALFLARARAVSTGFASTRADAEVVARVCRRLAGIPLALELAAARARVLSPRMLLDRLNETLDQAGARDLPERQRTMRATLEWSYRLLSEAEQALFRRLSVFTGGAALDAVEHVAADLAQVLASLERLVDHSLVVVSTLPDGSWRYTMLEPVHQFASEHLTGDERDATSERHAEHYLAMALEAAPHFEGGGDQVLWLERIDQDDANLVTAIEWWVHRGDGDAAARMVWSLWLYWWLRGRLLQGRRLAEATLELSMDPAARVRALLVTASMAFAQGNTELSAARWRQARDLAHAAADEVGASLATPGIGLAALALGDLDAACRAFTTVVEGAPDSPGTEWVVGLCHVWLGTVRQLRGDTAGAVEQCELGLASARRRGDLLTTYVALYGLVQAALAQHRLDDARALLAEGIDLSAQTGDLANLSFFLESLGVVEGANGRHSEAAQLLGASGGLRDRVGSSVYGYYLPDPALRETAERQARVALGDDAVEAELLHGRSMTPDEAVAAAFVRSGSDAARNSRRRMV